MQDLRTGELKAIDPRFIEGIPRMQMQDALAKIQEARDLVVPERGAQGPMFFVGQELEILGARFRVDFLSPKKMVLKSLPKL
jgi:hypothetical protein